MSEGPYQPLDNYSWQIASNMVARSLNYRVAMGGGFGGAYTYGCDWLNSTTNPWDAHLGKGARPHIKFFSDLFKDRSWWNLKPDWDWTFITASSLEGASRETGDNYTIAAYDTARGALGLVYCTVAQTVTVSMARMSGAVTARWYDPTSGNYVVIAGSPFANTGSRQFTTPAATHSDTCTDNTISLSGDWVLVLESPGQAGLSRERGRSALSREMSFRHRKIVAREGDRLRVRIVQGAAANPTLQYDTRGALIGAASARSIDRKGK
jgi:hypothetical protein